MKLESQAKTQVELQLVPRFCKIVYLQPFLLFSCTYFSALVSPWWEILVDKSKPQMKAQVELKVTC